MKNFTAGEVLTESDLDVYCVNSIGAVKTSTESVTSSTTLQDDNDLTVTVAANSTYEVSCFLKYDGPAAADLKIQFSVPASAAFEYGVVKLQSGASDATSVAHEFGSQAGSTIVGTIGSGTNAACRVVGTLEVAGTAGTFKLQWAQNTSDPTAVRVWARSFLICRRIS
jgi:hypothetical protein